MIKGGGNTSRRIQYENIYRGATITNNKTTSGGYWVDISINIANIAIAKFRIALTIKIKNTKYPKHRYRETIINQARLYYRSEYRYKPI